jgi:hypothetical protein
MATFIYNSVSLVAAVSRSIGRRSSAILPSWFFLPKFAPAGTAISESGSDTTFVKDYRNKDKDNAVERTLL